MVAGHLDDPCRWVSSKINRSLPEKAVFVGLDTDGSEIYAGRLVHGRTLLPANIIPRRRLAVASIDDHIVRSQTYDVLIGTGFAWVDCINGQVPPNAIKLFSEDDQDDSYMGRIQNNKCLKLGRISPAQRCLFVPHNDDEHRHSHYQALVKSSKENQATDGYQWIAIDGTQHLPRPANVVPSKDGEGSTVVGRLFYEGEFLPAEVIANFKLAVAVYENSVITSANFEVLTGTSFAWEPSSDGGIPSGAIASGKTLYGEWLFIGRVKDDSHVRIGKVHPSHGRIYVPHNSKTKTYQNYEVLVQQKTTPPVVPMVEGETSGKCCVCWENEATMAVVPCGNLCLCCQCCQNPLLDRCPVCQGPKLHCIRIFKT
jgi:Protein of unknown function (DUF3421)